MWHCLMCTAHLSSPSVYIHIYMYIYTYIYIYICISNVHCTFELSVSLDHQSANMTPPSTHCDLPDGMLQMVRAPDKSPRTGA